MEGDSRLPADSEVERLRQSAKILQGIIVNGNTINKDREYLCDKERELSSSPLAKTENISATEKEKSSSAPLVIAETTSAVKELSLCEETPQQEVHHEFMTKEIQTENKIHLIIESACGSETTSQSLKNLKRYPRQLTVDVPPNKT